MNDVLTASHLSKQFGQGHRTIRLFDDVSVRLQRGEMVALLGQSGSGKSTLLQILGLLDRPSAGTLAFDGSDVTRANDTTRTGLRRQKIGFVYQHHHLLPEFSALENVAIPLLIAGTLPDKARHDAGAWLEQVGVAQRATHRPGELSGGERQRVAIARALSNKPLLLLADEPTGNLDPDTADQVFALLISLVKGQGMAALIATHNHDLAERMDRVLTLKSGVLSG